MSEPSVDAIRQELERVLASTGFSHNERLARFLRFVVERHLEGRQDEIKESVIALDVFERRADFDPKVDSIVRTEAARLRARLGEYYAGEGKSDSVIIELPKGGYAPVFRRPAIEPDTTTLNPVVDRSKPIMRLRLRAAVAIAAVTLGALGWWWSRRSQEPITIAVLPLTNLSQDSGYDYFADGLTGEIIRKLSVIEGLAVRSQTSSFAVKGKTQNVRDAGRELNADYIVEGSVLRSGRRLRINAQFVRVRDDFPMWSGEYDREMADIFIIQDEISRSIVNSLRLNFGQGRMRYETSAEAYDLYLGARALPIRHGLTGYDESLGPFQEAIGKDPRFAPAYAGLAMAHAVRSGQFRFDLADEMLQMRSAAEKAIQLDPLLSEAYDALGMVYARDAQWERSERSFRRAIELDPSSPVPHSDFAMFLLWPLGRMDAALRQLSLAQKSDPLSSAVHLYRAAVLISTGRYEEAALDCVKARDGKATSECLGRARLAQGRLGDAIRVLESEFHPGLGQGNQIRGELGNAYARAGRREDAEKLAASTSPLNPFNRALIFAGLGDKDRTLEALDRAVAAGPFRIGRALTYPEFALLRGDPRVKALRKKVGLPE